MRRLSLKARLAAEAMSPSEIHVLLLEIRHRALPSPIRLPTDNTERLTFEPLHDIAARNALTPINAQTV